MGAKVKKGSMTAVQADLSDKEKIRDIVQGVDGIIHIAGHASDWGSKQQFYQSNVLPLEHYLTVIDEQVQNNKKASSVGFFIHTSSISVYGFGSHKGTTEDGNYYPPIHFYQQSKLDSEDVLLQYAARHSSPAIGIIRPGNVYGPGDTTIVYPLLDAIKVGKMGYLSQGKRLTCPIFIDDLVAAYMALMNKLIKTPPLVHGRVYNITGGETITWREKLELCADSAGLDRPSLSVPGWIILIIAHLVTGIFKLFRAKKAPDLTPYRITNVINDYHFSIARAMGELDWKPKTKFSEGILPTVKAWQQHGKA